MSQTATDPSGKIVELSRHVRDCEQIIADRGREIERLRAALEDAVNTLEAMNAHENNLLYTRLRGVLEANEQHTIRSEK